MYTNREGLQFGYRDVWDYSTLGAIMTSWLKSFKKHGKVGCPFNYLEQAVGEKDTYSDEDIEKGLELLYADIDDLIWALDDDNSPELLDLPYEEWRPLVEKYDKEREEKLKLFAKLYQHLWI